MASGWHLKFNLSIGNCKWDEPFFQKLQSHDKFSFLSCWWITVFLAIHPILFLLYGNRFNKNYAGEIILHENLLKALPFLFREQYARDCSQSHL